LPDRQNAARHRVQCPLGVAADQPVNADPMHRAHHHHVSQVLLDKFTDHRHRQAHGEMPLRGYAMTIGQRHKSLMQRFTQFLDKVAVPATGHQRCVTVECRRQVIGVQQVQRRVTLQGQGVGRLDDGVVQTVDLRGRIERIHRRDHDAVMRSESD
jgi:hypothetical protein